MVAGAKFHNDVYNRPFQIRTDHKPLLEFLSTRRVVTTDAVLVHFLEMDQCAFFFKWPTRTAAG